MMLYLVELVNKILALGAIASQIFIVAAIAYLVLPYKKPWMSDFFAKHGIKLAFAVALLSVAGSLFYSNYAGFVPCPLCWFQRIFMYPEVILLGLALIKKDNKIIDYSLALSVIGLAISLYDNYIYFTAVPSTFCTISAPCTTAYVVEFGYITIPIMALTGFALINLFLMVKKYYVKNNS